MKLCYQGIYLKGFVEDNQEVPYPSIPVTPEQAAEIEKDYHNWYINPHTLEPYRKPTVSDPRFVRLENDVWVEIPEEEKQAIRQQDFLAKKQNMLSNLQSQTYNYIASRMPDWRLNRWKSYYALSQKVANNIPLTALEQAEYDSFLDPGETHADCAAYVPIGLQWVLDCIEYHKQLYLAIYNAQTQEELDAIPIEYPIYPLEF